MYAIADRHAVLAINPQTGQSTPLITGLHDAANLTVDALGRLYVGCGARTSK